MPKVDKVWGVTITGLAGGSQISDGVKAAFEIAKLLDLSVEHVKFIHNDRRYTVSVDVECTPDEFYKTPPFTKEEIGR